MNITPLSRRLLRNSLLMSLLLIAGYASAAPELPLYGPVYTIADEAYKAYGRGDYQTAIAKAREAIRLRPDVARLQALLADAEAAAAHEQAAQIQLKDELARVKANSAHAKPHSANSAFSMADTAYKAFNAGNYEAAVNAARKAVHLAPGKLAYRQLLVNALASSGRLDEADTAADDALRKLGNNDALLAQRNYIRRQRAVGPSEASDKALARSEFAAAVNNAHQAVELAPEIMSYRIQLIRALLAAQRLHEADQAATDAIKEDNEEPVLPVLRGYIRQQLGRRREAIADFDRALKQQGLGQAKEQNIRFIAADAALAAGEPQHALDLLLPLGEKAGQPTVIRRAAAAAALRRIAAGRKPLPATLGMPQLMCSTSTFGGLVCDMRPGAPLPDPAFKIADSAYRALGEKNYAEAIAQTREAIHISPDNPEYPLLLVNALAAAGRLDETEQEATDALKRHGDNAQLLALRGSARKKLGKADAARADFTAALASGDLLPQTEVEILVQLGRKDDARQRLLAALAQGPLPGLSDAGLAYLASSVDADAVALEAFDHAAAAGTLPDGARRDAAFAAIRLARNDQAVAYFKQAVDAAEVGRLALGPQELFDTRRSVAELSRQTGAYASLSYRGLTAPGLGAAQSSSANDSLQFGAEAYWRPWGYQNGRLFEVYGRVAETLSGGAGVRTGRSSVQGTVGARVKPFGETNVVLALERLFPMGSDTDSDWLARAGYSHSVGTDLRVEAPSWTTTQVYAEAGRYMRHPQNYLSSEGQLGRSMRLDALSPMLVLNPHVVLAADYNSTIVNDKSAIGAGVGTNLRYWFHQDRYRAPGAYADLSLQYRVRLAGDERAKGMIVRMTVSY